MWSGPRNLSTAMMYAFAARGDCAVWDEPFYAAYLSQTGLEHPMREDILAAGEVDPVAVAKRCLSTIPQAQSLFYQKHMCQHMLSGMPRDWMREVQNVFLIRHPARVLASFAQKYEEPTLADIGFAQQAALFDELTVELGQSPLVIDSYDIRQNPRQMLQRLCTALGLSWTDRMLSWPAGGHPDDGVWAVHWYSAVHRSTGFAGPEGPLPVLTGRYAEVVEKALPYYQRLKAFSLSADDFASQSDADAARSAE
ncbi:sulfotransferase [Cognatishimia sp. MH4019]|uniref:sulfotransferase n=1 Tax=Cognatishimia sp. MH4019 TaxID=2854030 RepID=UPI001CD37424|nr:sulfotransferase [Cognatishimia sp. MH4019]